MVFILVAEPWIPTLDMFKIVGKCQKLYSFTNRCIRGNFYWKAEQRAKVIMRLCMLYPTGFKWAHVACWYIINFSLSLSLVRPHGCCDRLYGKVVFDQYLQENFPGEFTLKENDKIQFVKSLWFKCTTLHACALIVILLISTQMVCLFSVQC